MHLHLLVLVDLLLLLPQKAVVYLRLYSLRHHLARHERLREALRHHRLAELARLDLRRHVLAHHVLLRRHHLAHHVLHHRRLLVHLHIALQDLLLVLVHRAAAVTLHLDIDAHQVDADVRLRGARVLHLEGLLWQQRLLQVGRRRENLVQRLLRDDLLPWQVLACEAGHRQWWLWHQWVHELLAQR
jgi:hypothetical protein